MRQLHPRSLVAVLVLATAAFAQDARPAAAIRLLPGGPAGSGVPGIFSTIQAAVDAAAEGDTIELPEGTLSGSGNCNVLVTGKNLTIRGAGTGRTVIDCQGAGRAFLFLGAAVGHRTLLEDLTIQNGAQNVGGGLAMAGSASPILRGVEIRACSADTGGGIYSLAGTDWLAEGLVLRDNHAAQGGGGISMQIPRGRISKCLFEGNSSDTVGGGVVIGSLPGPDGFSGLRIEDSVFRANTAAQTGGGLYSEMSDNYTIDRCVFTGNAAVTTGGAIDVVGDFLIVNSDVAFVQNCLIVGNTAAFGGGLRSVLGSLIVQNCTIVANEATTHAGGLFAAGDGLFLLNSILWDNDSPDASVQERQLDVAGVNAVLRFVFFNDVQGSSPGPSNLSVDPQFVAPGAGDYRLQTTSPCVDAGLFAFPSIGGQRDLDRHPRVQGAGIDLGAYEVAPPGP